MNGRSGARCGSSAAQLGNQKPTAAIADTNRTHQLSTVSIESTPAQLSRADRTQYAEAAEYWRQFAPCPPWTVQMNRARA
ncbi:hypothetical protein AB0C34_16705 [Nocardia sp. NPDC049220]|uniref:hypothetical protein n=1 Tax=Nocardia sp. NPDC049220 TaxID=3155273 RepID=UPI00340DECFF